jgi:arylsulfatase A-like enzyme
VRNRWLACAAAALAALLLSVPASHADTRSPSVRDATETRPNILLIVTDDQRAGTLGVMRDTLRIFRRYGTTYSHTFAVSAQCCPSRAAMWTGQYPHNNGVVTNNQSGNLVHESTIQRYLHDAGYATAMAGKYLNHWDADENPPYLDHWAIHTGTSLSYYFGGMWNQDGISDQVDRYSTDFVAHKGRRFLQTFETNDEQPWFIYLAPLAPHVPSQPESHYALAPLSDWVGNPAVLEEDLTDKPPFIQGGKTSLAEGQEIRANQLRTLMSVDDLVRGVVDELEALGEADNTLAIFTSDNGSLWGEHRLRGKTNLFTQATHIPLMMRWPGVIGERQVDGRLVGTIDIAPTILDAAGIQPDAQYPIDGLSLLAPPSHDDLILSSPEQGGLALRTQTDQYSEYYSQDGKDLLWTEYYDLVADPWQLTDVLHDADPANDIDTSGLHDKLSSEVSCKGIFCS